MTADVAASTTDDIASAQWIQTEYAWIDGVEDLERYAAGGYHPVTPGSLICDRYRIINKLGYGTYSTIWLAQDKRRHKYVAIKIGVSGSDSVRREVTMLREVMSRQPTRQDINPVSAAGGMLPQVLDDFEITGPNGTHVCCTLAPLQSDLASAREDSLFHIPVARALSAKLALAVSFIHARGFCHGDIHLGNVLIDRSEPLENISEPELRERYAKPVTENIRRWDGQPLAASVPRFATYSLAALPARLFTVADAKRLVLSDFGEAFEPSVRQRLGRESCIPLENCPPEVFLESEELLSYAFDVFALGCTIWDIIGESMVFGQPFGRDRHVSHQINVLGHDNLPPAWQRILHRPEDGSRDDMLPRAVKRRGAPWPPPLEQVFETWVQEPRREWSNSIGPYGEDESAAILNLIRGMLKLDPRERMTVDEVLRSEWMTKWAIPELQRAVNE